MAPSASPSSWPVYQSPNPSSGSRLIRVMATWKGALENRPPPPIASSSAVRKIRGPHTSSRPEGRRRGVRRRPRPGSCCHRAARPSYMRRTTGGAKPQAQVDARWSALVVRRVESPPTCVERRPRATRRHARVRAARSPTPTASGAIGSSPSPRTRGSGTPPARSKVMPAMRSVRSACRAPARGPPGWRA